MRTLLVFVLAAGFVLFASAPVAAGDWDLDAWADSAPAWAGHGVGSMVHRRTTTTIAHPQMPAPMKTVTEEKQTLLRVTDTHYVLKVETLAAGMWQTSEESVPKVVGVTKKAKFEEAGTGSVTIEGKEHACKKKKYTDLVRDVGAEGQEASGTSGVVWVNEEHGVLRVDSNVTVMGKAMTTTWQVERLSVTHKVGETSLACREIAIRNPMMGGKMTMLECPALPGGTARMEMKSSRMGAETSTVTELVAYVKK